MLNVKFKLVRQYDEPFTKDRLLKDMVDRIKSNISDGRVLDDTLGFGFTVETGKPATLKNYLYHQSALTPVSDAEGLDKVRNLVNA
jgi:hypothetical protein